MIKVNAKHIRYALRFVGIDDIRYYLNGIHIRPSPTGGAIIEASDGHTAALFHDAEGQCDESAIIMLSQDAAKHCRRRKYDREDRQLVVEDERAMIMHRNVEQFVQPGKCRIDYEKFPDIPALIAKLGKLKPGTSAALSPQLLRRFQFDVRDGGVGLQFYHAAETVVVRNSFYQEFVGLLMAMRDEPIEAIPDWAALETA